MSTASRPNVRDDREAPLLWERDGDYKADLRFRKIRIFFQKGLDRGVKKSPR